MIRTKLFLACALAFAVSLAGTAATAQEPTNQITYFTFSAPFELPGGKTLPPGKYVFKIVDSPSNRHIVQVMSEDQQTMHATLMAIPAERQDPADEPEVRFMETEANAAPAIRTWWYPGRSIGHEFIYPKDHARRLAARQSEGVLTTAGDASGDDAMKSGDLARIGANGQETAWSAENNAANTNASNTTSNQSNTSAQTAATAETTTAQSSAMTSGSQTSQPSTTTAQETTTAQSSAAQAAPQSSTASTPSSAETTSSASTANAASTQSRETTAQAADTTARTELPRTASPLPLIGLLGLASLLGAGVLRFGR